jgi:geranylgeranyl diphosphate synthase, type I
MATDAAALSRIRQGVSSALEEFVGRQHEVLAAIGDDMLPWLRAVTELLSGGKRLRPAFCYWGWRAAGGADCDEILTAAAALELLHASALVHDDLMDASDTRRGNPAVHRQFAAWHSAAGYGGNADQFGAASAILIGDVLLAWTDEMYHRSGLPPGVLRRGQPVLDAMRTEVISGQFLDLVNQAAGHESVASAMRVVTYKTAKYTIERPLHLGAALAGSRQAIRQAFTGYGIPLGIAFQLRDDVLGVFGDPAQTGKPVSGDVREGKRTVLIALARERAGTAEARLLDRALGDRSLTDSAAAEVRAVIAGSGALAECEGLIAANVKEAVAALDGAAITTDAREALAELAVAATDRLG